MAAIGRLLVDYPVVRITGPSGVGKSSLLRAGVVPDLREKLGWRSVVVRPLFNPHANMIAEIGHQLLTPDSEQLTGALDLPALRSQVVPMLEHEGCHAVVLLIDQAEEVLSPYAVDGSRDVLGAFLREVQRSGHLTPMIKAVVAYRTDTDARLGPLWQEIAGHPAGLPYHTIDGVSREAACCLISTMARRKAWAVDVPAEMLAEQLAVESVSHTSGGGVYPPYLQVLLSEADATGGQALMAVRGPGTLAGLIARHLDTRLRNIESRGGDWVHSRRILEFLSLSSGERLAQPIGAIEEHLGVAHDVAIHLLDELQRQRLVRPIDSQHFEIQHDQLAAVVVAGMAESDLELKAAAELLRAKAGNHAKTGELLTRAELCLLYSHRKRLRLAFPEKLFLLASMVTPSRYGRHTVRRELGWYWFSDETPNILNACFAAARTDDVREAVGELIAKCGRPEDLPVCRCVLMEDGGHDGRAAALAAIADADLPEDLPLMRGLVRDADGRIARLAIEHLSRGCRADELPLLEDLAYTVAYTVDNGAESDAVEAIAGYPAHVSLPLLRKLAAESCARSLARQRAIQAIGKVGLAEDRPLLRRLTRDSDPGVGANAVDAIARHVAREDAPLLRRLTKSAKDCIAEAALRALRRLSLPEDIHLFENAARGADQHLAEEGIRALPNYSAERVAPLLEELARSKDSRIADAAIDSISKLEPARSVPMMRRLLIDKNRSSSAIHVALARLAKHHDHESLQLLYELAGSDDPIMRNAAVIAMAKCMSEEVTIRLQEIALATHDNERREIIEAIAERGAMESLSFLTGLAKRAATADIAARAIRAYPPPVARPLLRRVAGSTNVDVRKAALMALAPIAEPSDMPLFERLIAETGGADCAPEIWKAVVKIGSQQKLEQMLYEEMEYLEFDSLSAFDSRLYRPEWWPESIEEQPPQATSVTQDDEDEWNRTCLYCGY